MEGTLKKWGNSQGLRFSKAMLEKAKIAVGDRVEIIAEEGQIVIKTTHPIRGKYKIQDLVAQIPQKFKPEEISWGSPVGGEEW
jgi:antitoxin MazE